jgi:hypothetical protein
MHSSCLAMDLYGSIMLLHVLRYDHAIARLSVRAHTTDARATFVCGVARDQPVHHPPFFYDEFHDLHHHFGLHISIHDVLAGLCQSLSIGLMLYPFKVLLSSEDVCFRLLVLFSCYSLFTMPHPFNDYPQTCCTMLKHACVDSVRALCWSMLSHSVHIPNLGRWSFFLV